MFSLKTSSQPTLTKRKNGNPQPASETASPAPHYDKTYFSFALHPVAAFTVLTVVRLLAALYSPIADCDETYNYWEPMHYLLYGFGFQTWEYSPEYALRSYAYLYPYALIAKLSALLFDFLKHTLRFPFQISSKIFVFYAVRICMAFMTSLSETLLFSAIQKRRRFGNYVAILVFIFLISSPGMFRSSVEFLPSTFSMLLLTAAHWAWMENHLCLAIFCVAVASLLGWVFSAILAVPLAIDVLLMRNGITRFFMYAIISGIAVIAFMVPIDTHYFGVLSFPPLNHILYNIFPKEGAGSHIFGEESWTFYAKNLVLNCNLPALLFLGFPFLFLMGCVLRLPEYNGSALKDRLRFLSGSYLAIAVFILQPHKEERFLAPCYPLIALVGAVAMNDLLNSLWAVSSCTPLRLTPKGSRKRTFVVLFCIPVVVLNALLGFSRILMQVKSFHAPLSIYERLSFSELRNGLGPKNSSPQFLDDTVEVNICIGSEWYRFPSSFFLPHKRFRARFISSGFDGLLPKPFQETENGTRIIPSGMNEFNKADPQQFYNWSDGDGCHYFINLELSRPIGQPSPGKPSLPMPSEVSHIVYRERFLDSESSRAGFRAFYLPRLYHKLAYGEYQLIRNIKLLPIEDRSSDT